MKIYFRDVPSFLSGVGFFTCWGQYDPFVMDLTLFGKWDFWSLFYCKFGLVQYDVTLLLLCY